MKSSHPRDDTHQSRIQRSMQLITKPIATITTLSLFLAAVVHITTFIPEARKTLFPVHEIVLLDLYSQDRIVLANTGDFDYHLSHISYKLEDYSVSTLAMMREMLTNRENELFENCVDLYLEAAHSIELAADPEINAKALDICASAIVEANNRLSVLENSTGTRSSWVPGEKNRSIGQAVPSQQTVELSLGGNGWSNCNYLKIGDEKEEAANEIMDQALALWAITYQNFPGECLEANYFYRDSRNYLAYRNDPGFLRASIHSKGAVHYSIMEVGNRTTDTAEVAIPGQYNHTDLPGLVSNFKYRDSNYCSVFLTDFVDIKTEDNEGGSVCFQRD